MSIIGATRAHGMESSNKRYNIIKDDAIDGRVTKALCAALRAIRGLPYTPVVEEAILEGCKPTEMDKVRLVGTARKPITLNGESVEVSELDDLTALKLMIRYGCQQRVDLPDVCELN